jgi:hypothetical protein
MLNMKVDNPYAFRFIMEDEIYLLDKDKGVKTIPSTENIPVEEAPAITKPIVETPQITFNYLGDNNKRFLVLGNYATEEFIAAEHLTALGKYPKTQRAGYCRCGHIQYQYLSGY